MATTTTMRRERTRRVAGRSQGGSRDYTTAEVEALGASQRLATAPAPAPATFPRRPRRDDPTIPARTRRSSGRLGSQQVVSHRGRRLQPLPETAVGFGSPWVIAVVVGVMLIAGVVTAMWLSGLATQQTFRITSLVAEESQLDNEIETMTRDLRTASSTAEIARQANAKGMVLPEQPAILNVDGEGTVTQSRDAGDTASAMRDLNETQARPAQASSDPTETKDVGTLNPVPQGQQLPSVDSSRAAAAAPNQTSAATAGVAPYAAREAN